MIFRTAPLQRALAYSMFRSLICLVLAGLAGIDAQAQLRLPLPELRAPGAALPRATEPLLRGVDQLAASLSAQRSAIVDDLLQRHAAAVVQDPSGNPAVRAEIVVLAPSPALLEAARQLGMRIDRDTTLEPLQLRIVVLQLPPAADLPQSIEALRRADPAAELDYNHLYVRSGSRGSALPTSAPARATAGRLRLGLIDGGVEADHPALRAISLLRHGCTSTPTPSAHGTAVASLLAAATAAPSSALDLYAADIFCGVLPAGTVVALADAMAWLLRERVPVVNISLVGPPNLLLGRVVRFAAAQGQLIVAAVGNDGPHAPPLYPAAYAEVVGVTAVDAQGRILPEAAQGPQVRFAALGVHARTATLSGRYDAVRGTSFATPLVALAFARMYSDPRPGAIEPLIEELARQARDLGAAGRDTVFGYGLVDPSLVAVAGVAAGGRQH